MFPPNGVRSALGEVMNEGWRTIPFRLLYQRKGEEEFMGEQVGNALFLHRSLLSLSIPRVSTVAVLLSVTTLLARDVPAG